jgi:AcrR family transcriptional regulator
MSGDGEVTARGVWAANQGYSLDKRRRSILDTAAELFATSGFDRTSVADIAQASGLEKPSLYHYFKSKKSILSGVLDLGIDDLISDAHLVLQSETTDVLEKLYQLFLAHSRNFEQKIAHVKAFLLESRVLDQVEREKYLAKRHEYEQIIIDAISTAQAEGSIRDGDPVLMAYGVLGMFNWMVQWYRPAGSESIESIGGLLAEMAMDSLVIHDEPSRFRFNPSEAAESALRSVTK